MACSAIFASCDPSVDSVSMPTGSLVDEATLAQGFTYKQFADEEYTTEAADGNYFKFFTNPGAIVRIFTVSDDGSENVLSSGVANGTFVLAPSRGQNPDQTIYIETHSWDGTKVKASKSVNVHVATELTPEMVLICSNDGAKTWKWDTALNGGGWGNIGYTASDGETFADNGDGTWWSCAPADLAGQMQHSATGSPTGEEDPDAYMIISENGKITTYTKDGAEIRSGNFTIVNYNPDSKKVINDQAWSVGQLQTPSPAILFPYAINKGGYAPTEFEIVRLTADQLILTYADAGTGSWSEATFWRFCSNSDPAGMLASQDAWTWDTDLNGGGWGNIGYTAADGETFADNGDGTWWSCAPADLAGQMQHSAIGSPVGEEDPDAYMIFGKDGIVTSYDAAGNAIHSGDYSIKNWDPVNKKMINDQPWSCGQLQTKAGSILFPYAINKGGFAPTEFEIVRLNTKQLILTYADEGTGSWSEATFWRFKSVKK